MADKDRAFAFAPHRIDVQREDAVASLTNYLRYFFDEPSADATTVIELRRRIVRGAQTCLQDRVVGATPERAGFILDTFRRLEARSLPELVRTSLRHLPLVDLKGPEGEQFLSLVVYIVNECNVLQEDDQLADYLEAKIRMSANFRPALFYSLKVVAEDIGQCLAKLHDLTQEYLKPEHARSWRTVSEQFDNWFGREAVRKAIIAINSNSARSGADVGTELVPAARLAEFYPGVGGLFANNQDSRRHGNEAEMRARGLDVSDNELVLA